MVGKVEPDSGGSRYDQILAVAAELFATRGFRATSVRDIGDAVGLAGSALYQYFPNKQSILDAICLTGMRSLLDDARQIVDTASPARETLDDLIKMRVSFQFGPHGSSFLIGRNEVAHLSAAARRKMRRMDDLYRAEWLRVLSNVRPDTETIRLQVAWLSAQTLIGFTFIDQTAQEEQDLKTHLFQMAKAVMLA